MFKNRARYILQAIEILMFGLNRVRFVSSWGCHGVNEGVKPPVSSQMFSTFRDQGVDVHPKRILSAVVDALSVTPQVHISLCLGDKPERRGFLGGISY